MTHIKERVEFDETVVGDMMGDHFIKQCMILPPDCERCASKGMSWCECKDHDCKNGEEDGCEVCNFSGVIFDNKTKKTLMTSYKNTTENSTVYVYQCTDGKEVWREERLKRLEF